MDFIACYPIHNLPVKKKNIVVKININSMILPNIILIKIPVGSIVHDWTISLDFKIDCAINQITVLQEHSFYNQNK